MIGDAVGMSAAMVARTTRFEGKRKSGKAALVITPNTRSEQSHERPNRTVEERRLYNIVKLDNSALTISIA